MDRLSNTVNWTASEFVQALKDVGSQQPGRITRLPERGYEGKCNLMFEFTVALLRLLEFVALKVCVNSRIQLISKQNKASLMSPPPPPPPLFFFF